MQFHIVLVTILEPMTFVRRDVNFVCLRISLSFKLYIKQIYQDRCYTKEESNFKKLLKINISF